jgi:serine protease AprX
MDTVRRTAAAIPARGRSGPLLALALAATTAISVLSPAVAAPSAASAPGVHVVVTAAQSGAAGVASAVRAVLAAGGTVDAELPLVGGVSATLPAGTLLPSSYVVADDRRMEVASTADYSATAAATVRSTLGLGPAAGEGDGVLVAVVDTGVAEVKDLEGRVEHAGVVGGDGDGYGHGTFVAGLIAGNGASSGGKYAGVAPAARILDVRVAREDGSSSLSLVLLGLQKVAARADVDVVNVSLSSGSPMPWQIDPLTRGLESLWNSGKVVVVPSGNEAEEISSPGVDPLLLTVGGLDESGTAARDDDVVAAWSGRGPTDQNDAKPDLVAPGRGVVSLRAPGSVADSGNPGSRVGDHYFVGSGTSFSTALTSGAAATLLAQRPSLSPDQVKVLFARSAYKVKDDKRAVGAGGLDVAAALAARTPTVPNGPKGDEAPAWSDAWQGLFEAILDGDQNAANSWSQKLTDADRQWVARNWTARNWTARNWTANSWSDLGWAATPGRSVDEWHALIWAAEVWAARNWTARNWTADEWAARNWTDEEWAARNWTARNWTARNWTARNWTARNWTARNWTARNWTARNWSAVDWAS